ncbi:hypothetical protein EMIT0P294_10187 [Pseudomonas sp. IT-P294]
MFLLFARRQGFAAPYTYQCRLELIQVVSKTLAKQRQGLTAGLTAIESRTQLIHST